MSTASVPEDCSRVIGLESAHVSPAAVAAWLREDRVVLLQNVARERADPLLQEVASELGMLDDLQLQASYASLLGHRQRVGTYRMSVNQRSDYQFIPPHSEGDSFINMQLAAFYCIENSTDGGATILMNVDPSSEAWGTLRESVTRIAPGSRQLTAGELKQARGLYRLRSAVEVLPEDKIIREHPTRNPGLKLVDVLAPARKTRSAILECELYAYWVSISIMDHDALPFFVSLLQGSDLLRHPPGGLDIRNMDNVADQRHWASGVDYNKLFR